MFTHRKYIILFDINISNIIYVNNLQKENKLRIKFLLI